MYTAPSRRVNPPGIGLAGQFGGFLVEMEFVGGGSLEDRLEAGKPRPPSEAVRVFRGLVAALSTAHAARIIHGDIKPANVLFGADDTVKLADFGVARILTGTGAAVPLDGQVFGSPLYMAPEVISGQSAGPASDLWSAAVLLQLLLTGRTPFPAETIGELVPKILRADPEPMGEEVPAGLRELVMRCLAKDAAARPPSADAVLEGLEAVVAKETSLRPEDDDAAGTSNLVPPADAFVGREEERTRVVTLLADEGARLVTVTGPPGVGKSRVALEAAARLLDRYAGGVWFVDLAPADDVESAVLAALDAGPGPVADALRYRRPFLLLLDGFEAFREDAPRTIGRWMQAAPASCFLVTSRELLSLGGERPVEVPPLSAADADRLAVVRAEEAGVDPGACGRGRGLGGFPLAIEAAVAAGDPAAGREALFAALAASVARLDDAERAAFLAACEHADGFTLEEAEARIDLSAFPDAPLAMDALQILRDRGLLVMVPSGDEVRFATWAIVRGFGLARKTALE